ncbi:MAG: 50S ribosomal protein L16 [Anaerolineales bacterium]
MLMPKRFKFPKMHRGRMRGKAARGADIHYGEFGLQSLEPGWVSARQLEAARRAIVREARRRGKVWIRVFPDKPITKRAAETRMGKGKGAVEYYAAVVKPGRILFEVAGMPEDVAQKALTLAAHKLSVRTKIIGKTEFLSE